MSAEPTAARPSSEFELAAIVQSSEDAISGITLDGTIACLNRAAERLYGYSSGEAIGQSIRLIIPADRSDEFESILERVGRGVKVEAHETIRLHKDGSRMAVSVSVSPIRNVRGEIVGAASIGRGIGDRRKASDALTAREGRYRRLLDMSPDGIVIREDVRVVYANAAALRILGAIDAGQLVGHSMLDFVHPDDRQSAVEGRAEERAVDDLTRREWRFVRTDGTEFLAEVSTTHVSHDGRRAGASHRTGPGAAWKPEVPGWSR